MATLKLGALLEKYHQFMKESPFAVGLHLKHFENFLIAFLK